MAVVAGGPVQTRGSPRARSPAALSGVPGRSPAESSSITSSESPGTQLDRVAQQLERGAGGHRGVEAALLHAWRRARSARRRAGRRSRRPIRSTRVSRPGPAGSCRRMIWPLTGWTGPRAVGREPGDLRPTTRPAAITTCAARDRRAVGERDARRPGRRELTPRDRRAARAARRRRASARRAPRSARAGRSRGHRGRRAPAAAPARAPARAAAPRSRAAACTGRPSVARSASSRSSASASSPSRATSSVPQRR